MLQLQKVGTFHLRVLNAKAKQFPLSYSGHGQSSKGPTEGSCTKDWSCQLYHHGGDSTREEVLPGTFFLNEHPVIILFDSGASRDFISSTCAKKAMLSLVASGAPYVISTPRGRVDANRIVLEALLELSRSIFSTNLIILSGKGIDVILGMSWMKLHRAVLDKAG
jgi:hypothetical protein